ncbi:MAG: DUF1292 domain-containing protein [Defluviitaleaceae bacterium]|nr:DUF1292 domain-containing protein [Defluviitaleaceae bacterium]
MKEFDPTEGIEEAFDLEDNVISMVDEDGNEIGYSMLATKKDGDSIYLLVEEILPEEASQSEEMEAEVLIFKCTEADEQESELDDDMIFELVDEDHESFELAFSLFKADFDAFGIMY